MIVYRKAGFRWFGGNNSFKGFSRLSAFLLLTLIPVLPMAASAPSPSSPWSADDLIEMALQDDPDLLSARSDARSAAEKLKGARARRGPTLGMELGTSYLSDPLLNVPAGALGSIDLGGGPIPMPSEDIEIWGTSNDFRYDLKVILEQPLFTWGKISSGIAAAEAGSTASRWAAQSRENELRTGIITALESLSILENMLEITGKQKELGTRLSELTRRNFEEGFLLETEYRDTRNRLQQIILAASALANERQNLLLSLERVTGLKGLDTSDLKLPEVDDSLESYTPGTAEKLIADAWKYNPDIMALSSMEDVAEAKLGMARGAAAARPDLAFRTEFGYGGGFDRMPDDINGTWKLTIGARTTLIDSGLSRSGIRTARAGVSASAARSESGRRQVESFIRSGLYSMSLNRDNIAYYAGLRDTDTARAQQKKDSFDSGYGREEEWLLAELDSMASELSRLKEVLQYIRSYRQVLQASGIPQDGK